ncbi:hypothetical protein BP6252_00979 [Coleophoma cylindrospora]|uniref:Leucine rich repeat protein n=1 Tax=Coleophoma cylindrospora TaxID=1849047 RepID=A0A3D8SRM4_9HELO|nr:hypothetical protein BP6252_00979 [Coleophoma cylindrospora]
MSPPSYNAAIDALRRPAAWELVAAYMDASSLAACCLINHELSPIFTRALWCNPIPLILQYTRLPCRHVLSFLSARQGNDQLYSRKRALVEILDFRSLRRLRQQCDFHHEAWTCHELLTGNNVRDRLALFPNCKILLLDQLPGWTECKEDVDPIVGGAEGRPSPVVLSVANCAGLSVHRVLASKELSNLLHLDLSGLPVGEKIPEAFNVSNFSSLRILKMRAMRLQDKHMEQILGSFGPRLWYLDVRDNLLTDRVIRFFDLLALPRLTLPSMNECPDLKYLAEAPAYHEGDSSTEAELANDCFPLRPADADILTSYLKRHGTLCSRESLSHDDALLQPTGLTQLYVSGNKFTSRVAANLLTGNVGGRIQLLDVGTVLIPDYIRRDITNRFFPYATDGCLLKEQILEGHIVPRLEQLRIHHSIITIVIDTGNGKFRNPHVQEQGQQLLNETFISFANPDINPHLHTLTLTSIPFESPYILRQLITFLQACAEQEQTIRSLQSKFVSNGINYKRRPKILTGLRVLRLEFLPKIGSRGNSISASGEAVADTFLEESSNDFSFFGERLVRSSSPLEVDATDNPQKERDEKDKAQNGAIVKDGRNNGKRTETTREMKNDAEDIVTGLKRYRASPESRWTGRLELVFPSK